MRKLNLVDNVIHECDQALRTMFAKAPVPSRDISSDETQDQQVELSEQESKLSANLMRVNHAGEVAAQGLYRGQALTAKNANIREQMEQSAQEENDHLYWCEKRLDELNSHTSYLSPVWYLGSFSIGATAGMLGDKWSLGFVKETEDQVVKHIDSHLQRISPQDTLSTAILKQMRDDESHHASIAQQAGAARLPWAIRKILMPINAKVMTTLAFRI